MKIRKIIQIVAYSLTLLAALAGILMFTKVIDVPNTVGDRDPISLVSNFAALTSLLVSVGSIIGIIDCIHSIKTGKISSGIVYGIKFTIEVGGFLSFLSILFYALPKGLDTIGSSLVVLFIGYIVPLLFTATNVILDLDRKWSFKSTFFAPIIITVFAAYTIPMVLLGKWVDGYELTPYFQTSTWWKGLLLCLIYLAGSFGVGFVFWLLNKIIYLIFVGEQVDEEISTEEEEVAKTVEVTKEDEKEEKEAEEEVKASGYIGPRVYHISRHKGDNRWQVKFANGQRALKILDTQAEAIVFAKQIIKKNGGSLRVHSVKGRIRKA